MAEWDYASLSHTASEHGGPEKYINEVAETNYQRGVEEERGTEWWKMGVAICAFELVKAGIKWTVKKVRQHREKKRNLSEQARKAKANYLNSIEEARKKNSMGEEEEE